MTKILCLILTALLLVCMCGCSVPDEENILGTWQGTMNYASYFNSSLLATHPEMADYWHIEEFNLVMNFTFWDDGTFKVEADRDKLSAAMEQLRIDMGVGYLRYMTETGQMAGKYFDDTALAALMEQIIGDDYYYALLIETEIRGNYKVEDGKLFASADLSQEAPTDSYEVIQFKNGKLILKEFVGAEDGGIAYGFHPLTLKRK